MIQQPKLSKPKLSKRLYLLVELSVEQDTELPGIRRSVGYFRLGRRHLDCPDHYDVCGLSWDEVVVTWTHDLQNLEGYLPRLQMELDSLLASKICRKLLTKMVPNTNKPDHLARLGALVVEPTDDLYTYRKAADGP